MTQSTRSTSRWPVSSSTIAAVSWDSPSGRTVVEFLDGGSDTFAWCVWADVERLASADSVGRHYWQTFRAKYKDPTHIDGPPKPPRERKSRAARKPRGEMVVLSESGVRELSAGELATRKDSPTKGTVGLPPEIVALVAQLVAAAEALEVRTFADKEAADALARKIDDVRTFVRNLYGPHKELAWAAHRGLCNAEKAATEPLEAVKRALDKGIVAFGDRWRIEQARIAAIETADAQAKMRRVADDFADDLERAGDAAGAAEIRGEELPPISAPPPKAPPIVSGGYVTGRWKTVRQDDVDRATALRVAAFVVANPIYWSVIGVQWTAADSLLRSIGPEAWPADIGLAIYEDKGITRR